MGNPHDRPVVAFQEAECVMWHPWGWLLLVEYQPQPPPSRGGSKKEGSWWRLETTDSTPGWAVVTSSVIHSGKGLAERQAELPGSQAESPQQIQSRGCALSRQVVRTGDSPQGYM